MLNEKATKELGKSDLDILREILSKGKGSLSEQERGHLIARRDYLTAETLREYGITELEEMPVTSEPEKEELIGAPTLDTETAPEETKTDYSLLKKSELIKECKKRNIGINVKTTKEDMVELIEADDRGELEEE